MKRREFLKTGAVAAAASTTLAAPAIAQDKRQRKMVTACGYFSITIRAPSTSISSSTQAFASRARSSSETSVPYQ
jgi:TRAP-type mannitol/chloroaromatic compound transport system substrate-binding protein